MTCTVKGCHNEEMIMKQGKPYLCEKHWLEHCEEKKIVKATECQKRIRHINNIHNVTATQKGQQVLI